MKPRDRNISYYIDLKWEDNKPRIYVAGKPFLYCSFLVAHVDTSNPKTKEMTIEDLADQPGARNLEGIDAVEEGLLTAEEVMFGFASSLEGWVREGYASEALHANLSFPLLRELVKAGDPKAKPVMHAEIAKRIAFGHLGAMIAILDTCSDELEPDEIRAMMRHSGTWIQLAESEQPRVLDELANYVVSHVFSFHIEPNPRSWHEFVDTADAAKSCLVNIAASREASGTTLMALPRQLDRLFSWYIEKAKEAGFTPWVRMNFPEIKTAMDENLAGNLNTPGDLLVDLARSPNVEVRERVAINKKTPGRILSILATDRRWTVRQQVAYNKNTPVEALKALAADDEGSWDVRIAAAGNKSMPGDVLERMFNEIMKQGNFANDETLMLKEIAANPNTPVPVLEQLLKFDYKRRNAYHAYTEAVALNQAAPQKMLAELAKHFDNEVRELVAMNRNTSSSTLLFLSHDENEGVKRTAITMLRKRREAGLERNQY